MKKLIGKLRSLKSELIRRWKAETPMVAKCVRNIAGTITVVVPVAWATFQGMNIELPAWFSHSVGYITLASLILTGAAGIKEKKKEADNGE
jgi:hypothetical protein